MQIWHNAANWSKGDVPTGHETALILDTHPADEAEGRLVDIQQVKFCEVGQYCCVIE